MKTVQFGKFTYIGDPCNSLRIFNELEVDELMFLDITATKDSREPKYDLIKDIASECFMPLTYGGGVRSVDQARKILNIGVEKICINSAALDNITILGDIAREFGTQAVVGSIDYRKRFSGRFEVVKSGTQKFTKCDVVSLAKDMETAGVGEILLTCIDREGTWSGYELETLKEVTDSVNVPVIANGGCGSLGDLRDAVTLGGASALALGSMVVFQKKGMGVLINFPDSESLEKWVP